MYIHCRCNLSNACLFLDGAVATRHVYDGWNDTGVCLDVSQIFLWLGASIETLKHLL